MAIGIALLLLGVLLFGFDTKPENQKLIEKSRAQNFESTSIDLLLGDALQDLNANRRLYFEKKLQLVSNPDSVSLDELKAFSGEWYDEEQFAIAGYYAEIIAKREETEAAWSIAGTTYAAGIKKATREKERLYCYEKAVTALQNAISLNPENLNHQINLAIVYTDIPPDDNPMKGIQMLLDINEAYPDNTAALLALGRLAIQTGQFDRAKVRLEKVVELLPEDNRAYCLLTQVYQNTGETNQARVALEKCQKN